jgi:hypothetical protein
MNSFLLRSAAAVLLLGNAFFVFLLIANRSETVVLDIGLVGALLTATVSFGIILTLESEIRRQVNRRTDCETYSRVSKVAPPSEPAPDTYPVAPR